SNAVASYRCVVRFDGDAMVLFLALTAIFLVSVFVLPFLGYVTVGLSLGGVALSLDIPLAVEARKRYRDEGGERGPRTWWPPGGRGGGGRPGGGSGVREPRRPKDRPPAAARARH